MLVVLPILFLLSALADDARGWLLKAQQHFQRQQWEKSRQAAAKALEIDPTLGDAEVILGLIATMRSDFSEAEKHFLRAVSFEPRNPRTHAYLGSTYLQEKRLDAAARSFGKVLELDPGNSAARYNLGLVALAADRPGEALGHFEHVLEAHPRDAEALIGVIESQLLVKRGPEAANSARQLHALLPPKDPRLLQVARLLAMHDSYEAAAQILTQFHSAEALNLLGAVEERRSRVPESLAAFRQAAELQPRNEGYRFDYAGALLQYRNDEAALRAFQQGVQEFPKSWKMRLGLGSALYLAGKYEEAARALLEAARIEPSAAPAYYLLGHAYESASSRQKEILAAFQAYLSKKPNDAWAYYHYGYMLYLLSQNEGQDTVALAKANVRKALDLNPSFPEALLQLGVMADSDEEGIQLFERAVRLNPKLALAHYRLGLAYQRLGNAEKAKEEVDLFRKLKAEDVEAQRRSVLESLR